jgi:hypothetical protein
MNGANNERRPGALKVIRKARVSGPPELQNVGVMLAARDELVV